MSDVREIVLSLLAQAGISPTPDEIDRLVDAYAETRAGAERLYTVPGVRYEEPAVMFDPRQAHDLG